MPGLADLDPGVLEHIYTLIHRNDLLAACLAYRDFNELRPDNHRFRTDVLAMYRTEALLQWATAFNENPLPPIEMIAQLNESGQANQLSTLNALQHYPLAAAVHARAIIRLLPHSNTRVQSAAQRILDRLYRSWGRDYHIATNEIIKALDDPDPLVRRTAITQLYKLCQSPAIVHAIVGMLNDPDNDVRQVAWTCAMNTATTNPSALSSDAARIVVRKLRADARSASQFEIMRQLEDEHHIDPNT